MAPDQADKKWGWLYYLYHILIPSNKNKREKVQDKKSRLEPKYWPEVMHFIENLNNIIKKNTIEDSNIQGVNQRILDYVLKQINSKGYIEDIEERYSALHTLADRILIKHLDKIVGLKASTGTHADFSEAVENFKKSLDSRHQAEIWALRKNNPPMR